MANAAALFNAYTEAHGESPINRLYRRIENAKTRAAKLDTWTRNPANDPAEDDDFAEADWEHNYREMRRERAKVTRCLKAIRRIDAAVWGTDYSAFRPIEGRTLWGR